MTLHEAVEKYGSKRAAAKALGIPWTSFRRQYKAEKSTQPAVTAATTRSSIEQQVADAGFSMDDVASAWIKSKEHSVQVKKKKGGLPKPLGEHLQKYLEVSRTHTLRGPESVSENCMLVIGLHDFHLGKLTWSQEDGEDYDLDIASAIYRQAVADTLSFFGSPAISKVVLPIGSDFFHSNNFKSETESGTKLDSTDDRMSKVFDCGVASVVAAIDDCLSVADVQVVWIPGNHDRESSWYLSQVLRHRYENNKSVTIDHRDVPRKYIRFGDSLIGMTHKPNKRLPLTMSIEASKDWCEVNTREWHVGHYHTRREERYMSCNEELGVIQRTLPSLSTCDSWHNSNLFINNLRAAESFLYSYDTGYAGSRVAKVREVTHE